MAVFFEEPGSSSKKLIKLILIAFLLLLVRHLLLLAWHLLLAVQVSEFIIYCAIFLVCPLVS